LATGAAALAAFALGGSPAGARGGLSLDPLPGSYSQPTFVAQAPGSPRLLFIVEQAGRIAVLRDGQPLERPFLNMTTLVASGGEQGLLSMAFDPNYDANGRFYVYFTNHDCGGSGGGCNVEVDGFRRSSHSHTRARVSSRYKVIEVNHHEAGNHNGGQVQFGPDGHLYLAPGDGGTQGDPDNDAQRKDSLLGKVLRIDPTPGGGHTSPASNPYVGKFGRDEIFARGLRNPYRFSFDRQNGDLWIGDVGGGQREEIDRSTIAQANGGNFGWHFFEGQFPCGAACGNPGNDPPPNYIPPIHDFPHGGVGETGTVVIAGFLVRNPDLPSLNGKFVYADYYPGDLRSFNPQNDNQADLGLSAGGLSSFGEGLNGEIYVASQSEGKVYELVSGAKAKAAPKRKPGDGRGGVRLAKLGDFSSPNYVTSAPGVPGVTYVVQLAGKVIAVKHGSRHTFLNIKNRTTNAGERGLLSIAFDPHFKRNGLAYTYSTNNKGQIEIDEFHAKSNLNAREKSRRRVIAIPHPGQSNHNGGTVQFGPDGKLYFATGDGGSGGDPPENSQNKHRLLGKLLRIDPHKFGGKPYRVPKSNPFVGRNGRDEIYALGLRNPFRFSFDRRTGHIEIGDVGQESWEEVDYESAKSLRRANFGWDHFEGFHRYNGGGDNEAPRPKHHYEPPIFNYSHGHGCAIIGGYLVRDGKLRSLRGRYLYADLCAGKLRSLVPHPKHASGDKALGLAVSNPNGFGLAHGHVYVASGNGPVYRLAPKK
jgi:glucose/arabinose dehydrogenase